MRVIHSKKNNYLPEIDGLRAFAIITVIANHFNKEILPGGYLGVDIFFVISGFVITSSLSQNPSKNFKDFIIGFYERRIRRLLPALMIFVLISSISICFVNPMPGTSLLTGAFSLFGLSNLYLLNVSTDYFAQSTQLNLFTNTWSLGVEEQFYFIFPFLIFFSGFLKGNKNSDRNFFLTMSATAIISLIIFIYLYPKNQSLAYFSMPTRFWEIAIGCLLFIGLKKRPSIERIICKFSPSILFLFILGIMFLPSDFAVFSTIGIVILTSGLIVSIKKHTHIYRFFSHPKVVYIGLISYSLYLWHWFVLSISRWTIGIHWWSIPIQIFLIFFLANLSYKRIELPLRRRNWFRKKWKNFLISFLGLTSILGVIFVFNEYLKNSLYTGKFTKEDFTYIQAGMKCELAGAKPTKNPLQCIKGDYQKRTIYIFGDSHASNLVKSIKNSIDETIFENVKYLTSQREIIGNRKSILGTSWYENKDIDQILSKTSNRDLIVWSHITINNKDKIMRRKIIDQLKYLQKINRRTEVPILIIDDIVSFGSYYDFYPKFSFYRNGPSTKLEKVLENRNSHTLVLKSFENIKENIYYFDPIPYLCDTENCNSVINGKLIYSDYSPHFNKEGANILTKPIRDKIFELTKNLDKFVN